MENILERKKDSTHAEDARVRINQRQVLSRVLTLI
jgi:hypothetical protein